MIKAMFLGGRTRISSGIVLDDYQNAASKPTREPEAVPGAKSQRHPSVR
jgi:hypothetical protein